MSVVTNITPSTGDEQLMQMLCGGNRKAFELLYDRYFDKLVWFAFGFVNDRQKAEDVVQEVFLKVIEKPEQFDSTKKFSTWVYTVTGNVCRQVLRNEQNRLRILKDNVTPGLEKNTVMNHANDQNYLREKVKNTFETLNEKEKNIYLLRFEQELSIKEIAEIIQIPEGSVKSGIYYLLKKFANNLKEFSHEK